MKLRLPSQTHAAGFHFQEPSKKLRQRLAWKSLWLAALARASTLGDISRADGSRPSYCSEACATTAGPSFTPPCSERYTSAKVGWAELAASNRSASEPIPA